MREWRLVPYNEYSVFLNMAIDEAMLVLRAEGAIPDTVRFYKIRPSAVTMGYFQSVTEDVNTKRCSALRLPIVRRITGGGAVYHDAEGEITYAVVASEKSPSMPRNIAESYRVICGGIVQALRRLGLEAEFKPINDVVIGGKKVSGSAQTRRRGAVLQHGTLLYDTDIDTLASVLLVPREKLEDKRITSIKERVTTVSRALGRKVSDREVVNALVEGFSEALNARFVESGLTERELRLAEKLVGERYSRDEWNYMI